MLMFLSYINPIISFNKCIGTLYTVVKNLYEEYDCYCIYEYFGYLLISKVNNTQHFFSSCDASNEVISYIATDFGPGVHRFASK